MTTALLRVALRVAHDIFAVRQRGREVAAAVGLESQDQVRLATALSEVGRQVLVNRPAGGEVVFAVDRDGGPPRLVVEVVALPEAATHASDLTDRVRLAGRLLDSLEVSEQEAGTVIRMTRRLPAGAPPLTPERIEELRARLAELASGTPLEELAVQNEQLFTALEQVRAQRDDLARLNAELEETHRGVTALYTQLSGELEETNRGVVALYAELDSASAQVRTASEAKSRFLANVSHELRAPVTAIIGLSRLLTDSASDPLTEEQQRHVALIRGAAVDLLSLVNDLLDLAKAESGRLEPHWMVVDLPSLFGQLRGTLRAVIPAQSSVELVVDEPLVGRVRTDETLLTQALRNLLTNGLKFTDAGEVRLSARPVDGDRVEFAVADTGIGIPPDEQERIFEEFYQVPGVRKARLPGTGLGLPYARRLVALLGGELLLVRSVPEEGSTFTVTLPLEPPGPGAP